MSRAFSLVEPSVPKARAAPAQAGVYRRAFSLVELSIVLVILGLLTGGILAGQSLIRAAELRSVTSEYQRYTTAVQTFRDKYMAIPGDMANATRFWGRQANQVWCVTNSGAAVDAVRGVCDGDGNGNISGSSVASQSGENYQFWRQLGLAGLIEGSFSGLAGAGSYRQLIVGTNAPPGKLGSSAWYGEFWGTINTSGGFLWAGNYGNGMIYGGIEANDINEVSILRPEEVWNIDTKMDDGRPAFGNVRVYFTLSGCATNSTYAQASIAEYNVSNSSPSCFISFITGY